MSTPTAEIKRVRFSVEDGLSRQGIEEPDIPWDHLRYLLSMHEEFDIKPVVESLVQKGIISADAGSEAIRIGVARAQIEFCIKEVAKGGHPAYASLLETLEEHGHTSIIDSLKGPEIPELSESESRLAREGLTQQHWSQSQSIVQDGFGVQGKKMALSALSRDAKASQREFSVIVERQQELEKQLVQVMKSLDSAKDMLIRERQEKLGLRDQLKGRDEELVAMQRKYLELQKAMSALRDTNNKYHEKVTRLQIENETLRREMREQRDSEYELKERTRELERLRETLKKQDVQMKSQEEHIVNKLAMIEKVVGEHRFLKDGQETLTKRMSQQASEIVRLNEEKAETQNQVAAQQRQLDFQNAQIVMLQEQMQRLESNMGGNASGAVGGGLSSRESLPPLPGTPDNRGQRYISSLSKGMTTRPFNTQGKLENSKNAYWKGK